MIESLGCGASHDDTASGSSGDFAAPPSVRATLVIEPPELGIGEVATVELAVVTPPEFHVLPVAPVEVPGLGLIGVRALPLEEAGGRWVHRTEFRVRPRALGTHEWPAVSVRVESQDGHVETLALEPRSFEVKSVGELDPGRKEPFGPESLETPSEPDGSFWTGLAVGLGISGFALLSILGLRRAGADRAERSALRVLASRAEPAMSLADWSRQEVDRALDTLESDPRQAANTGALLLRTYMARRYGGGTDAATTEELERRAPTLAQRSLWPDFIRILRNFDDVRFRPGGDAEERRRRTRRALEDSLRLVDAAAGGSSRGDPTRGRNGRDVPRDES